MDDLGRTMEEGEDPRVTVADGVTRPMDDPISGWMEGEGVKCDRNIRKTGGHDAH